MKLTEVKNYNKGTVPGRQRVSCLAGSKNLPFKPCSENI